MQVITSSSKISAMMGTLLIIESDFIVQNVLVPKFSIQLLCENAIKHGMIDTKTPFTITIQCFKNETVSLKVSNNGKAITKSTFGIGLTNLQERLQYLVRVKSPSQATIPLPILSL